MNNKNLILVITLVLIVFFATSAVSAKNMTDTVEDNEVLGNGRRYFKLPNRRV